jgi:hypothetical protein
VDGRRIHPIPSIAHTKRCDTRIASLLTACIGMRWDEGWDGDGRMEMGGCDGGGMSWRQAIDKSQLATMPVLATFGGSFSPAKRWRDKIASAIRGQPLRWWNAWAGFCCWSPSVKKLTSGAVSSTHPHVPAPVTAATPSDDWRVHCRFRHPGSPQKTRLLIRRELSIITHQPGNVLHHRLCSTNPHPQKIPTATKSHPIKPVCIYYTCICP